MSCQNQVKSWAWVPGRATEKLKSRDMDKMTQKAQQKWQKGWDQERVAPTGASICGGKGTIRKTQKTSKIRKRNGKQDGMKMAIKVRPLDIDRFIPRGSRGAGTEELTRENASAISSMLHMVLVLGTP